MKATQWFYSFLLCSYFFLHHVCAMRKANYPASYPRDDFLSHSNIINFILRSLEQIQECEDESSSVKQMKPESSWHRDISSSDANSIQNILDAKHQAKRDSPSLSIVNPLDVLRKRLLLEMARRQMKENTRQVEKNRAILKNIGKRMNRKASSSIVDDWMMMPVVLSGLSNADRKYYTSMAQLPMDGDIRALLVDTSNHRNDNDNDNDNAMKRNENNYNENMDMERTIASLMYHDDNSNDNVRENRKILPLIPDQLYNDSKYSNRFGPNRTNQRINNEWQQQKLEQED